MTDVIENKLQMMYDENQPDSVFADQLEQELRRMHIRMAPARPVQSPRKRIVRQIVTVAASFAIVLGLVVTVPPLRSLAQSIFDFFIPGDGYVLPGDENAYADVITVETVAEAESIAGIEALEWVEGGFNILHISAADGFIHIAYERENDRGVLMHITKWRTGTRPEQDPISTEAEVFHTTVDGIAAQFVTGAWFGEVPYWEVDHYRQLRWEAEGFSYHLLVSSPFARSLEQAVAVAESLR